MINLYHYQNKYISDLPARCIMAAALGTGKSFMSLAHYAKYRSHRRLLILAPASKIRTGDWQRDIQEFFGDNTPEYEIYSYEKFSRDDSIWKKFSPMHGGELADIIADECHRFGNPQSKIGKAVYFCAKSAPFFVGLSGTPLPNGWISFANYSKIFGFTKNVTEFKGIYCNYQTFKGFPELIGYKKEDELKRQWNSISKRLTRSEATELPDKQLIGNDFKVTSEYKKVLKTRVLNDELLDNSSKLSHALRKLLIQPKLSFISDIIGSTDENIVLFYNYESELQSLLEVLETHKNKTVYQQNGHKHEIPLKHEWSEINNSVTLAHYKSGGTGVEMQYASITIFVSPTYSYSEYAQSIGRTYRNGQEKKTLFYFLRTKGSIEEAIYKCLKDKNDFSETQWYKSL